MSMEWTELMAKKAISGFRQRLACRRAAGDLEQIPRSGVSHSGQTRAVARGREARLLSQGQRQGLPRHDELQHSAARDLAAGDDVGQGRRTRCRRCGMRRPRARRIRRRGCETWTRWASIRRCCIRRGSPRASIWWRIPDIAYALARAYNDWIADFCKAAPDRLFAAAMVPLQNMDLRSRGASPRRKESVLSAALHPADVPRRPLLHASHLRSAVGGTRKLGTDAARCIRRRGLWNPEWTSHGPFFEKIKNRLHHRHASSARQAADLRWRWIGHSGFAFHRVAAARPSDGADHLRRGWTIICSSRRR